jgi:hypothetical protein
MANRRKTAQAASSHDSDNDSDDDIDEGEDAVDEYILPFHSPDRCCPLLTALHCIAWLCYVMFE